MLMLRTHISLALVVILISTLLCVQPTKAKSKQENQTQHAQRVKASVSKLGVGERARVAIRLQDNTGVRGYVYQVRDDDFIVRNAKTGADTTVAYRDVADVKGTGLSKGAKIGIAVGVGVAISALVLALVIRNEVGKLGK